MTKRSVNNSWTFLLLLTAALVFAGCSAGEEEEDLVPIRLSAGSDTLSADSRGAGVISPDDAFQPTFIASLAENDFTTVAWSDNASVNKGSAAVTFSSNTHYYPSRGEWVYIAGVHPHPAQGALANGKVTYTLDGTTDVMHAPPRRGNKWDSNRFAGNTLTKYDDEKKFVFAHLLTQLQIKAKKAEASGLAFTITGIKVKGITPSLSVGLIDGEAVFSGTADVEISSSAIQATEIKDTTPVDIANLLLPPNEAGSFTLDIETSAGLFKDVVVKIDQATDEGTEKKGFRAGYAHTVTLTIHDSDLQVNVSISEWKSVPGGGMDLVD